MRLPRVVPDIKNGKDLHQESQENYFQFYLLSNVGLKAKVLFFEGFFFLEVVPKFRMKLFQHSLVFTSVLYPRKLIKEFFFTPNNMLHILFVLFCFVSFRAKLHSVVNPSSPPSAHSWYVFMEDLTVSSHYTTCQRFEQT